jgi:hypothetical protein
LGGHYSLLLAQSKSQIPPSWGILPKAAWEAKAEHQQGLVASLVETVAPAVDSAVAPVAAAGCPTIREPAVVEGNLVAAAVAAVALVILPVSILSQEGKEVWLVSVAVRVAAGEELELRGTAAAAAAASGEPFSFRQAAFPWLIAP